MKMLKEIVKDTTATFSHACMGVLYYVTEVGDERYMFPVNMNDKEDVGTTSFVASYKTITLMRYVRKAMEQGELIKIK